MIRTYYVGQIRSRYGISLAGRLDHPKGNKAVVVRRVRDFCSLLGCALDPGPWDAMVADRPHSRCFLAPRPLVHH